jgi:hypothetical protein
MDFVLSSIALFRIWKRFDHRVNFKFRLNRRRILVVGVVKNPFTHCGNDSVRDAHKVCSHNNGIRRMKAAIAKD